MFTGVISYVGKLTQRRNSLYTFCTNQSFLRKVSRGTSVAVNGACLTVVDKPTKDSFSIQLIPETLKKTMLGKLKEGDLINLEVAATPETFLSGHIVQGHVDGVGKVKKVDEVENSRILTIAMPKKLHQYIVEKGSIAVNGVSLTVIDAPENTFTVGIIPYTWKHTMFQTLKNGDLVNIEVDILAKHIEHLLKKGR